MKFFILFTLLTSLLLAFQNCGETARSKTLFDSEVLASSDCTSLECNREGELLWLKIREYEPYRVNFKTLQGHFTVAGQCGTGLFNQDHVFIWTLREGFGSQQEVVNDFSEGHCESGRFQVPIKFQKAIVANRLYQLSLEIVGLAESGEEIRNALPTSKGSLDIIFFDE